MHSLHYAKIIPLITETLSSSKDDKSAYAYYSLFLISSTNWQLRDIFLPLIRLKDALPEITTIATFHENLTLLLE